MNVSRITAPTPENDFLFNFYRHALVSVVLRILNAPILKLHMVFHSKKECRFKDLDRNRRKSER